MSHVLLAIVGQVSGILTKAQVCVAMQHGSDMVEDAPCKQSCGMQDGQPAQHEAAGWQKGKGEAGAIGTCPLSSKQSYAAWDDAFTTSGFTSVETSL